MHRSQVAQWGQQRVGRQRRVDAGDADLLEAHFRAPAADAPDEVHGVDGRGGGVHQGMMIGGPVN